MESNGATTSEFVTEAAGPQGLFGVFEDDGDTGYFYLYEPGGREVFQHLHIYDRKPNLPVQEQDVRVVWSEDLGTTIERQQRSHKCGAGLRQFGHLQHAARSPLVADAGQRAARKLRLRFLPPAAHLAQRFFEPAYAGV